MGHSERSVQPEAAQSQTVSAVTPSEVNHDEMREEWRCLPGNGKRAQPSVRSEEVCARLQLRTGLSCAAVSLPCGILRGVSVVKPTLTAEILKDTFS